MRSNSITNCFCRPTHLLKKMLSTKVLTIRPPQYIEVSLRKTFAHEALKNKATKTATYKFTVWYNSIETCFCRSKHLLRKLLCTRVPAIRMPKIIKIKLRKTFTN